MAFSILRLQCQKGLRFSSIANSDTKRAHFVNRALLNLSSWMSNTTEHHVGSQNPNPSLGHFHTLAHSSRNEEGIRSGTAFEVAKANELQKTPSFFERALSRREPRAGDGHSLLHQTEDFCHLFRVSLSLTLSFFCLSPETKKKKMAPLSAAREQLGWV